MGNIIFYRNWEICFLFIAVSAGNYDDTIDIDLYSEQSIQASWVIVLDDNSEPVGISYIQQDYVSSYTLSVPPDIKTIKIWSKEETWNLSQIVVYSSVNYALCFCECQITTEIVTISIAIPSSEVFCIPLKCDYKGCSDPESSTSTPFDNSTSSTTKEDNFSFVAIFHQGRIYHTYVWFYYNELANMKQTEHSVQSFVPPIILQMNEKKSPVFIEFFATGGSWKLTEIYYFHYSNIINYLCDDCVIGQTFSCLHLGAENVSAEFYESSNCEEVAYLHQGISNTTLTENSQNCDCCTKHNVNISEEEVRSFLKVLEAELRLNASSLSSFIRKRVSARDDRPSAKVIGIVGGVFIGIILGGIVLIDLTSVFFPRRK